MKKMLSTILCSVMIAGTAFAQSSITPIEIGAAIPNADAKMKSVEGKEVSLADTKTKTGLLVMFSCNTCPYVIKSQERTKEMMKYATERGLGMVILNSNEANRDEADSPEAMAEYAKSQGYNVPYLLDEKSEVANAFGATRTPEVFLFDGKGKLVYRGAMEDNPASPSESKEMYLKKAINTMAAGGKINPATTKSIGCSIKRS
jgi:thioredoxin-related protein